MTLLIADGTEVARFEAWAASHTTGSVAMTVASARVSVPARLSSGPHFSDAPTDQEILFSGVLPQALAPMDCTTGADENRALARALILYRDQQQAGAQPDAVEPLTDFLRTHPNSRWRAALEMNLGLIYRRTGHMSKAMEVWQRAWDLSKHATDPNARAIADYSVGELANFEAYLGRMELLAPLLAEVKGRVMHGPGAAAISDAAQGLAEMRSRPDASFRCGPMALHRICLLQGRTDQAIALERSRSTTRGTSMTQVLKLAHEVGLNYQMAYRQPGAVLIVPAVMHWKVGHFAAIAQSNGQLYQVQDPTFGESILVSQATLDEEASGYFVVPSGPLPKGWRTAPASEGATVWGRGQGSPAAHNPPKKDCDQMGLTVASVGLSQVSLKLDDVPLRYQTAKGRDFAFELSYTHRDTDQPPIFTFSNFGPKWTSNWIGFFTDNTSTSSTADLYAPGGGFESYTFQGANSYSAGLDDQALVTRLMVGNTVTGFTRELPDGSVETYAHPVGTNQFFLSSVADPQGNRITLAYDAHNRITTITDAAGRVSRLSYPAAGDIRKVIKVTDPFGRSATFTYNSAGQLASITDMLKITSIYTYVFDSGDFISTLTTPYGVSHFTYGDSTTDPYLGTARFVTITDPLGQTSRVEYRETAPGIADTDPPATVPGGMKLLNEFLSYRNTFVWDAHEYASANQSGVLDYTKGRLIHWLHTPNFGASSSIPESIKEPLENRVWFNYPGQPSPIEVGNVGLPNAVGRVLDNGATQLRKYQRNSFGHLMQITDPLKRQLTLTYDPNGIDVTSIANTSASGNQLLLSATYDAHHDPLTITDASGQISKFTYDAFGNMLTATDPLHETTSFAYSPTGLLTRITRPLAGAVTQIGYDGFNRPSSVINSQGYQFLFGYDTADRLASIKYPDLTTTLYTYKLLDLASVTDRLKHTNRYVHDALRRLVEITDALGRVIKLGYCDCGSLSQVTDPNGHATTVSFDLEGRAVAKVFADNTQTKYVYEKTTSRLGSLTDTLGQATRYAYNVDDTLSMIRYSNIKTPPVSFIWDPIFRRIVSMNDGSGKTTFGFKAITNPPGLGAGLLATITGPHGDVVNYTYDALERAASATIDGAVSQLRYDTIGRLITDKNPLDTFSVTYLGATRLPVSIKSALGVTSVYSYANDRGDVRLTGITNHNHAATLISGFNYSYDANGEVTRAIIQKQFAAPQTRVYGYDSVGQLLSVTESGGGTPTNYMFGYDKGSNRTREKVGAVATNFTYNSVNEQISPTPAAYDAEGEPLKLGSATFQWDAAHRLIAATAGGKTTRFGYDGLDRVVRITQLTGATVTSDKFYFWCSSQLCLETDARHKNAITKRYFPAGVQINKHPFYYATDSMQSVRELVDQAGIVQASYDYDPFGVQTRLFGSIDSDIGFAGLFRETQSGLDLATYRGYSAGGGRWLNRDPIGEAGGLNLYRYAFNDPINYNDPLGLDGQITQYRETGGDYGVHDTYGITDGAGNTYFYDFVPADGSTTANAPSDIPIFIKILIPKPGKFRDVTQEYTKKLRCGTAKIRIVQRKQISGEQAEEILEKFERGARLPPDQQPNFNIIYSNCRTVPAEIIGSLGISYDVGDPLSLH